MKRTFSLLIVMVLVFAGVVWAQGSAILPYITTFIRTLLDDADQNTARTTLGVGTGDSPTFSGLALGSGNLTMTGSIGATGSRVTKGWFTDLECTNAMVGGLIALSSSSGVLMKNFNGVTVASFGLGGADSLNVGLLGNTVNTGNLTKTGCCVFNTNSAVFQPTADSTTFFQVLDADGGTPIFNIDSTNERVGFGVASPPIGFINLVTQADNDGIYIRRHSNTALTNAGIWFKGSADTSANYWKGAIIFERTASGGIGRLVFAVDGGATVDNAAVADALLSLTSTAVTATVTTFDIKAGGTSILTLTANNANFQAQNASYPIQLDEYTTTGSHVAGFSGRCARGTLGAATASLAGDYLLAVGGKGHDGTDFSALSSGIMGVRASENFSATNQGAFIQFDTTPAGSTSASRLVRVLIDDTGNVGIGPFTYNTNPPETLLEMLSTEPYLTLNNSTHEDTAGGRESRIIAKGEQSGGEETTLGYMEFGHDGAADDEKGYWKLYTNDGSDGTTPTLAVTVDSSQNTTFAKFDQWSVTATITAVTPGVQGDGALTTTVNEISVCANANDAVTLPAAVAGRHVVIINNGANTLEIWPASGDNAGAGVDTAVTLASGSNVHYITYNATNWELI